MHIVSFFYINNICAFYRLLEVWYVSIRLSLDYLFEYLIFSLTSRCCCWKCSWLCLFLSEMEWLSGLQLSGNPGGRFANFTLGSSVGNLSWYSLRSCWMSRSRSVLVVLVLVSFTNTIYLLVASNCRSLAYWMVETSEKVWVLFQIQFGWFLRSIRVNSSLFVYGVSFVMVNLKWGCNVSWLCKNCVVQLID
jgi:hypothetical protein